MPFIFSTLLLIARMILGRAVIESKINQLRKLVTIGGVALILFIFGLTALSFSAYFFMVGKLISPAISALIIAAVYFLVGLALLWKFNYCYGKCPKSNPVGQEHSIESIFHAFVEGYSKAKNQSEKTGSSK